MTNRYIEKSLCLLALIGLQSPVFAQANDLASGLQNRIVKLGGIAPERDPSGNINAGYFRLVVEDSGSANAAICPKVKYEQVDKRERKRWRTAENLIYSKVFKKNVSWTLTGDIAIASPIQDEPLKTSLRFASIQNAEESSCGAQIGDPSKGVTYKSFLVPINRNLRHFGQTANLTLELNYGNKADKDRIKNLWDGITLGVTTIIPAAAPVLDGLSDPAEGEIDQLLDKSNITRWTVQMETAPTAGGAGAYYLDLGFFHDNLSTGVSGNNGVNIKVEYIGTIFDSGHFLKDLQLTPQNVETKIFNTQVSLPSGVKSIPDVLGALQYEQLKSSDSIATFNANCTNAISKLTSEGLSEVDATIFVKAVGSVSNSIKDDLKNSSCLMSRNEWLKSVGMGIDTSVIALQRPTMNMVHENFEALGAMLQLGEVKPFLSRRFADKITVFADGKARSMLGIDQMTVDLSRDEALNLIISKFSNIGCYAPRESRPDLKLSVRPSLKKAGVSDFSGAAALRVRESSPESSQVMIGSFISDGFEADGVSKISYISITDATSAKDDIYSEMTKDRNCGYDWMKEMTSE